MFKLLCWSSRRLAVRVLLNCAVFIEDKVLWFESLWSVMFQENNKKKHTQVVLVLLEAFLVAQLLRILCCGNITLISSQHHSFHARCFPSAVSLNPLAVKGEYLAVFGSTANKCPTMRGCFHNRNARREIHG